MFRRTRSEAVSTSQPAEPKPGGKGRPTPTRKEAEAAARARAKGAVKRKEAARLQRQRRTEQSQRMRQALKTGDEKFLPPRDQGKVRRFVRDRIDARLSMAEFLLPLLILIMVMQYTPNPTLQSLSNGLWAATLLMVTMDTLYLVFALRRELPRRFPDESTKGAVFYGVLRAMQLRFLRLPKPRVKIGDKLPQRY